MINVPLVVKTMVIIGYWEIDNNQPDISFSLYGIVMDSFPIVFLLMRHQVRVADALPGCGEVSPTPSPAPRYTAKRLKTLMMILMPMLSTLKGQGSPVVESTAQTGCEAHLLLLFRLSPCNG